MDLTFQLVKRFNVTIFLCRGRKVRLKKMFGLDLGQLKTTLKEGGGLGDRLMVINDAPMKLYRISLSS